MGLFQSTPKRRITRSDVKKLTERFHRHAQKITTALPVIGIVRNSAAVLLVVSSVFMFAAISDKMWPPGGKVAGALVTLAFAFHLATYVLREHQIPETNRLLENFYAVVPEYMDTSNIPRQLKVNKLYPIVFLVEMVSLLMGFLSPEEGFSVWAFFAFILLGVTGGLLIHGIRVGMNDFCWVNDCRMCASTLEKLMTTHSENKEDTVIDIRERE